VDIKVPFSPINLEEWVRWAGPYRKDPDMVAKVFETILKTKDPDWGEIQVLLDNLVDSTEKWYSGLLGGRWIDTEGRLPGTAEEHFPSQDPYWDPNIRKGRILLERYQRWILFGFKYAMPNNHMTHSEFVEGLRVAARRYTNINPEKPEEAVQLASIFIGSSASDIRKKLQKLEESDSRDLGKLLEVAWITFNNRGEEEENKI
ncbi:hypothetical protein IHE44_0004829, partial [Lamprotornis superbus]